MAYSSGSECSHEGILTVRLHLPLMRQVFDDHSITYRLAAGVFSSSFFLWSFLFHLYWDPSSQAHSIIDRSIEARLYCLGSTFLTSLYPFRFLHLQAEPSGVEVLTDIHRLSHNLGWFMTASNRFGSPGCMVMVMIRGVLLLSSP
jgi:hypothetical protein